MPRPIKPASLSQGPSLDAQDTSKDLNTNMRSPQLYALYKQATQDPPIDKAETPGTFDFKVSQGSSRDRRYFIYLWRRKLTVHFEQKGKAKKRAWQKVVDEGITPSAAEEKYVELVESLKSKYGYDADKKPETVGRS